MATPIGKLRGMSYELEARLKQRGIFNSDQLLQKCRTRPERRALAEQAGIDDQLILGLANRADLARVHGIGGVFSDLLEHAGVDTVKELATRRPDNLHAKLREINPQRQLAGRMPTLQAVESWIAQAKELPRVLEY